MRFHLPRAAQARYALNDVKKTANEKNIPADAINSRLYGTMNDEAVLDLPLKRMNK